MSSNNAAEEMTMLTDTQIDTRPTMSDDTMDDMTSDIQVSRSGVLPGLTMIIKSRYERTFYHLPVTGIEHARSIIDQSVVDLGLSFDDCDVQTGMVVRDGAVLACVEDWIRRFPTPTMIGTVARIGRSSMVPCAASDVAL